MKRDKELERVLYKIGVMAGVDEDWYELGETEIGEEGEPRCGVYAKTDEMAEKVGKVLDSIVANVESKNE